MQDNALNATILNAEYNITDTTKYNITDTTYSGISGAPQDFQSKQEHINDDIKARLDVIETRLFILNANIEMEELYPELKAAYQKYKEIEARLLTFHALTDAK